MKALTSNSQGPLLRAITRHIADAFGLKPAADREMPSVIVESIDSVDWASLTFTGQRHRLAVRVDLAALPSPSAMTRLVDTLAAAEFSLPRHIVAEIAVTAHAVDAVPGAGAVAALSIEALTIDD